jgi:hypothetical protein
LEPPCSGGPDTGTNDFCSNGYAAENIGTVTQSQSVVVNGVLTNSGNDGSYLNANDDWDFYIFTIGETGAYTFTLDCFTTTTDGNIFQFYVVDPDCSGISNLPGVTNPTANFDGTNYFPSAGFTTPILPAGTQYILAVVGGVGPPLSPYRISVDPYFPPTPTPTP